MRLKEVREQKMLSQGELAKLAGMTRSQINRLENHKSEPRWSTVRKLVAALDVSADDLIVK